LEYLGGRYACLCIEHAWLQPSIGKVELTLDLLPHIVELKDRIAELCADCEVILLRELSTIVIAEVITKE
jgi:hypothetical protein